MTDTNTHRPALIMSDFEYSSGEEPWTPGTEPHRQFSPAVLQSMFRGETDDGTNGGDELSTEEEDDSEDALEMEGEEGHKLTADDTGTVEKGKLFFRRVHQQQGQSTHRVYNTQNR